MEITQISSVPGYYAQQSGYFPSNTINALSIVDFNKLMEEELERIYSFIEEQTWQPASPLQREVESEITFNPNYLRKVTDGEISQNISIQEFSDRFLGESIEPLPSIFKPLISTMLCCTGEKINATKLNISEEDFGVVSEIPQQHNIDLFLHNMVNEKVHCIVSLASNKELGESPYWEKCVPEAFYFAKATEEERSIYGKLFEGQFHLKSGETQPIRVYKIDPESPLKHENSWNLIMQLRAELHNLNPQIWVHCKVGLARSVAFKLIEKFASILSKQSVGEQSIDLVNMIVQIREKRPGIFPYKPAFIEICKFLQRKGLESYQKREEPVIASRNCLECALL